MPRIRRAGPSRRALGWIAECPMRPLRVGPWSLSRADLVLLPGLVALAGGAVWGAFHLLGFLGLGILGLIVGIIAANVELQGGRALGSSLTPNVYADAVAAENRETPAERAARRAEAARAALPLHVARVVSAGLIILGFGLFFAVQLRVG